jgi:RimJ/RimL family protein N-acetyltransferase
MYHRLYQATGSPVHGLVALKDGTVVAIRTVRRSDRTALHRLHRRLSERSVMLRFFSPKSELSDAQAEHFSRVDGSDRFALVALDPAQPAELIAVASYDRDPHRDHAEFAAVVEDRWQGRGLGAGLIRRLIEAARWRGICVYYGLFMPENISIYKVLQQLGLPPKRLHTMGGTKLLEIDLCTAQGTFAE